LEIINIDTYIDQFTNIDNYQQVIQVYEKYERYYPKDSLSIAHFDSYNASDHLALFKNSFDKNLKNVKIHTVRTVYTVIDYIFASHQFVDRIHRYDANTCRSMGINTQSARYNPEDNSYIFRYRSSEYEENLFAIVFNYIEEIFQKWDDLFITQDVN
jgi:hypothetical protein